VRYVLHKVDKSALAVQSMFWTR